jgi:protein-tyrosine phosphatase
MLLPKRKKKRTIVFVCTGNTCRSPMAQGLLQQYLDENGITTVEVRTAGVMTIPGLLPTPEAVQVMDSSGIDIRKHRSAPLTPEMIRKADLVLGMTPFHVQFALRLADDARHKTFLLKEYAKSDLKNYQISDPMGATLEVYKRVFREIKLAIDKLALMDCIHAPLDQELKHEIYTPPPSAKKAAAPPPPAEPEAKAPAAAAKKKTSDKKAAPAAKKPAAKKEPEPKTAEKKPAKTEAKKPAPKKPAAKPATKAPAAPAKPSKPAKK